MMDGDTVPWGSAQLSCVPAALQPASCLCYPKTTPKPPQTCPMLHFLFTPPSAPATEEDNKLLGGIDAVQTSGVGKLRVEV